MKIEGHGPAKILTQEEIELLFNEGLLSCRDRALFGICLYTACTAQACSLKVIDVFWLDQIYRTLAEKLSN
jgi:integrase/recombinase XerD